jgi:hypothetical protein
MPRRSFPLDGSLGGAVDGLLIDLKCWARALQAFDFPLQFSDSAACFIEAADFLLRFMRQVRKLAENAANCLRWRGVWIPARSAISRNSHDLPPPELAWIRSRVSTSAGRSTSSLPPPIICPMIIACSVRTGILPTAPFC